MPVVGNHRAVNWIKTALWLQFGSRITVELHSVYLEPNKHNTNKKQNTKPAQTQNTV
jgi:hypothetical protein